MERGISFLECLKKKFRGVVVTSPCCSWLNASMRFEKEGVMHKMKSASVIKNENLVSILRNRLRGAERT